jgi:putative endonuclease
MAFFTYILYSPAFDRFYIGQTDKVQDRLKRHNAGYEKATSPFIPWQLELFIEKSSRTEAMKLESKLKNLNRQRLLAFLQKYKAH